MYSAIMGMLAETNLHPGTGQVAGVVDLPVAREKITGYPVIVGSSLKGALLDSAKQYQEAILVNINTDKIFGNTNRAGAVAVTDGRLLLLPVRSLNSHYKWVTCPYLLERYHRDCRLASITAGTIKLEALNNLKGAEAAAVGKGRLYLEDSHFVIVDSDPVTSVAEMIAPLIKHPSVRLRLPENLVIVNDNEFAFFSKYALAVNARNLLDEQKISQNLWYEETIPPDTLFYTLLLARPGEEDSLNVLVEMFKKRPYLQVGANETVGQGWCAVNFLDREAN